MDKVEDTPSNLTNYTVFGTAIVVLLGNHPLSLLLVSLPLI